MSSTNNATADNIVRRAFYSFHFGNDAWRASQVRNMGVIDGNKPATDNQWEEVKKGGEKGIKKWIDGQMANRSVAIILIGSETADRKWVKYEIRRAWELGLGVLGVRIHKLKNEHGDTEKCGINPFSKLILGKKRLSEIVKTYCPEGESSEDVYACIKQNLQKWIEEAITIRSEYTGAKKV